MTLKVKCIHVNTWTLTVYAISTVSLHYYFLLPVVPWLTVYTSIPVYKVQWYGKVVIDPEKYWTFSLCNKSILAKLYSVFMQGCSIKDALCE